MTASSNLDLVRSIFAAWERGDFGSAEWAHPEIEFSLPDGPEPGTWTGLAAMAEHMRQLLAPWACSRAEPAEFRELDSERILVLATFVQRGKASGLEVPAKAATVFHMHEGNVTKLAVYANRDRALADLGLAPEGDAA